MVLVVRWARPAAHLVPVATRTRTPRPTAHRTRVLFPGAILLAGALTSGPLSAAPLYTVAFVSYTENSVSSAIPFGRDTSFALIPSNGDGVATGQGYSTQGRVGATHSMDLTWTGGSGAFSSATKAKCKTDDFIITGPAGPTTVAGTLNLRMESTHHLTGGYPNHGSHQARVDVMIIASQSFWPFASYAQTSGYFSYSNAGPFSGGCLAGQAGLGLDTPVTLSGNFPVNTPFSVELRLDASGAAYGNFATNPGFTQCAAGGNSLSPLGSGLRLEPVADQIMTLPVGYTLGSPSWGIVNNGSTLLGVGGAPIRGRLQLRLTGANPFAGEARIALELPRAASARVVVVDVAGRAVCTLVHEWLPAGRRDLVWNGRGTDGTPVPAGLYFIRGECDGDAVAARLARVR